MSGFAQCVSARRRWKLGAAVLLVAGWLAVMDKPIVILGEDVEHERARTSIGRVLDGTKLKPEQLSALRHIARQTPCTWWSECDDESCLLVPQLPSDSLYVGTRGQV